jgi:hypothetical protein
LPAKGNEIPAFAGMTAVGRSKIIDRHAELVSASTRDLGLNIRASAGPFKSLLLRSRYPVDAETSSA